MTQQKNVSAYYIALVKWHRAGELIVRIPHFALNFRGDYSKGKVPMSDAISLGKRDQLSQGVGEEVVNEPSVKPYTLVTAWGWCPQLSWHSFRWFLETQPYISISAQDRKSQAAHLAPSPEGVIKAASAIAVSTLRALCFIGRVLWGYHVASLQQEPFLLLTIEALSGLVQWAVWPWGGPDILCWV